MEHDVQGVRRLLGLRAAAVPGVSGSDEGDGGPTCGCTGRRTSGRWIASRGKRDALVPAPPDRAFRLDAPLTRVVATDYLVSVGTNRYSVPFTLIGQSVEVLRRNGLLVFVYMSTIVEN